MNSGKEVPTRRGILLVNLGTPERPEAREVGRYLREFLGDPKVIDLPWPLRKFLVNCIIVPKRAEASAANYRKVWTEGGSPLLVHGRALERALDEAVADDVVLAMRYGQPSIATGLRDLQSRGIRRILVVPLFPQYAEATTGSVVVEVKRAARALARGGELDLDFVTDFADHPGFIAAQAESLRQNADLAAADVVLMSFHGLPESQIKKADKTGSCLVDPDCCARASAANSGCYRARCHATARALAAELGLADSAWRMCFQSRLGRAKWIEPYTEELVGRLIEEGRRRFVVVSPAFVADCIETIEELGITLRRKIEAVGGSMELVPCVNASPAWVNGLATIVAEHRRG